jgi:hypothetical protein
MSELDFREREWGTADGRRVKFKEMELGHLVNCINWTHDNARNYPQHVRDDLIKEADHRKIFLFAEGKSYPALLDGKWQILDPVSGKGSIEKPPADYLEAVKDNEAYQRMAKRTQSKRVAKKQQP